MGDTNYARGPGRQHRSGRGPVLDAYTDGQLEKPCTNCHAKIDEFCVFPNGEFRHIPCVARGGAA